MYRRQDEANCLNDDVPSAFIVAAEKGGVRGCDGSVEGGACEKASRTHRRGHDEFFIEPRKFDRPRCRGLRLKIVEWASGKAWRTLLDRESGPDGRPWKCHSRRKV